MNPPRSFRHARPLKRFRVEFSGPGWPDQNCLAKFVRAQDAQAAGEWARRQLEAWDILSNDIRIKVREDLERREPGHGQPARPRRVDTLCLKA